jgi:hypothetical protein
MMPRNRRNKIKHPVEVNRNTWPEGRFFERKKKVRFSFCSLVEELKRLSSSAIKLGL